MALGSYWLVRNAPSLAGPEKAAPVQHDADYFMRGFVVRSYLADGELSSELFGKEGRHFPDTDTFEIDQVRLRAVSESGLVTRSRADRGLSNADSTEVQLFGNAEVIREAGVDLKGNAVPRLEFRGEFLHAYTDVERVSSDQPVTLLRGNDRFTADAMDYDNLSGIANLTGRVRGVLLPRPTGPAALPAATPMNRAAKTAP